VSIIESKLNDQTDLSLRIEALKLVEELTQLMDSQVADNKQLQLTRIKKDSKVKSL